MNISGNNATLEDESGIPPQLAIFIASLNVIILGLGVVGNATSFLVFRFHHSFKTMPSMVFLSFVAVTDTCALFEWNLSHFVDVVFQTDLQLITGCRFFYFAQYSSFQSSGLLLSAMCIDRYVTVMALPGSFLHRLPFRTAKTAFVWSSAIVSFCVLLNFHLLFTDGYYEKISNASNQTHLVCYKFFTGLEIAVWDQVNLVFYNIIPFLVMITFNSLLIVNIKKKLSTNFSSSSKKPNLTISLVIISFLFVIMTTPGTIMFAYFYDNLFSKLDQSYVYLIDDISFFNHSLLFFISFASIKKFRATIIKTIFGSDSQQSQLETINVVAASRASNNNEQIIIVQKTFV